MGAALWITSALSVFFVARIVPFGRVQSYLTELIVALVAAAALGVIATALDFGGWRDPDWRAIAFVLFGTAAAAAVVRLIRLARD